MRKFDENGELIWENRGNTGYNQTIALQVLSNLMMVVWLLQALQVLAQHMEMYLF